MRGGHTYLDWQSLLFVTLIQTLWRPQFITMHSFLTMTAQGRAWCVYADSSCARSRSLDGTGRKELYNVSARLPDSVQTGSCSHKEHAVHKQISTLLDRSNLNHIHWGTLPRPGSCELTSRHQDKHSFIPVEPSCAA